DHHEHHLASPGLLPQKTWIAIQIPPYEPCQQHRLKMGHETECNFFAQKRVLNLFLLAGLICDEHVFSHCVIHHHTTTLGPAEGARPHLPTVDERQHQPVR